MENSLFLQQFNENDSSLYYSHWQSVIAGFQEIITEIKELNISNDIEIFNMDDHADIHEIPMHDFVILQHFFMDVDEGNVNVTFNVGISTYADENNHRLSKLISHLFGRYLPGKSQNILDEDGNVKAVITFTEGVMLNQMSKSEMRSTQFITVTALSTATSSLYRD